MTVFDEHPQIPRLAPGSIRLLRSDNWYDGCLAAHGFLDDQPVISDATVLDRCSGGYKLKPEWQKLSDAIDAVDIPEGPVLDELDALFEKYEDIMYGDYPRIFAVYAISKEEHEAKKRHDAPFRMHVTNQRDVWYAEDGKPRWMMALADRSYCLPRPYADVHYWGMARTGADQPTWWSSSLAKRTPIGLIAYKDLFAPSSFPPFIPSDPRPDALKAYQKTWEPGDPVRLDWEPVEDP